jgi:ABC transport system ATP-binding/permease protein
VRDYVGGYSDWLATRAATLASPTPQPVAAATTKPAPAEPATPKKKLSYKDQRELEQLPLRIEQLEAKLAELGQRMASADFYQRPAAEVANAGVELSTLQAELDAAYARWNELDA